MDKLPHRVRAMRLSRKMTQEELAHAVGMKPPHLSLLERGQRPLTLDRMQQIAHVLGCSPADLLADSDNPDRLDETEAEIVERLRRMDESSVEKVRDIAAIFAPEPAQEPLAPSRKAG